MKIIIDPGHGGQDPGVLDERSGISEKYANLVTAFTLKHYLTQQGIEVDMTRIGDTYPPFNQRTKPRGANLLISIHYDWNKADDLIYYASENPSRIKDKELGLGLGRILGIPAYPSTSSQHKRLYIDDYKEAPAILWEVDNIGDFVPNERYRIERCVAFVTALKALWK